MTSRSWTAVATLTVMAAFGWGCDDSEVSESLATGGGASASTSDGGSGGGGGYGAAGGADGGAAGAGNGSTSTCSCQGGYLTLECFCELLGCDDMPDYDETVARAESNCQSSVFYDWGAVVRFGGEGECSTKGFRFMDEAGYDWGYYHDQTTGELVGYHNYSGEPWPICNGATLIQVGTTTNCGACLVCGSLDGVEPCDEEPGSG